MRFVCRALTPGARCVLTQAIAVSIAVFLLALPAVAGADDGADVRRAADADAALSLEAQDACLSAGEMQLVVQLWMRNVQTPATGFVAFLEYDKDKLNFDANLSAYNDPNDPNAVTQSKPFSLHVTPMTQAQGPGDGLLNLDGSVPLTYAGPGFSGDALLATLVFNVDDPNWSDCQSAFVRFRTPPAPFLSELSFQGTQLSTMLVDTVAARDVTPPVVAGSVTANPPLDASCETTIEYEFLVTDNCAVSPGVVPAPSVDVVTGPATAVINTVTETQVDPKTVKVIVSVDVSGVSNCSAVIRVTLGAADDCGNAAAAEEVDATAQDLSAPVIGTSASNQTVECDGAGNATELNAWLASFGGAIASDNCTGNVIWSDNFDPNSFAAPCPNEKEFTVTFTADDGCGNTSQAIAKFTIADTTAPSFTVTPSNVNLQCLSDPIPSADPNQLTATDVCGGIVTITWEGDASNNGAGCQNDPKTISRTYRATDSCGNFADHVQQFIIADTTAPTITTPAANALVECDGSGVENQIAAWLTSNGAASASDNCLGAITWSNDFVPGNFQSTCGGAGAVLVTFTATDACGNASNTAATFTINDTAGPAITTPAANASVECDGSGVASQIATWLSTQGGAAAADLCGGAVTWADDFDPNNFVPNCGNAGAVTVVFTATDVCGNPSVTQAVFTITDSAAPSVTTPAANASVECDGSGVASQIAAWLASYGGAAASDDCGGPLTWVHDFDPNNFVAACGGSGAVAVNFQAMDACGNTSPATSATFTINDTTAPAITTPASDASAECDGSGIANQIAAWLASNGGASASDDCSGPVNWSNDFAAANFVATCGGAGSVLVTFTAMDACGNASNTAATFEITDITPPAITTPAANAAVECDGSGVVSQIAAWLASRGGAASSDACGGAVTWANDFAAANFVTTCGGAGSVLVTFTASDACGNTVDTQATFTIDDTNAPTITTPAANASAECDGSGLVNQIAAFLASQGGGAAVDGCGGAVTWANDFDPNNFVAACGNTGFVLVNFQAQDACGNVSLATSATFEIADTTAPTVTCENVSVPADAGGCTASVALTAAASDDCNPVSPNAIVFTIDDDNNGFDPNDPKVVGAGSQHVFPQGITNVRAEATDACANAGECSFTVAVAPHNLISVQIELEGVFLPVSRCIHFIADDCDAKLNTTLSFVDHDGNPLTPVRAVVPSSANPGKLQFPCGAWTGLCAKDQQHTTWDTDPIAVSGKEYVMPGLLILRGGDTNNNGAVDINDITFLIFQFGQLAVPGSCPWNGAKDADFDNDGFVGSADYSFITANWLFATGCGCIDAGRRIGPPAEGVVSVAVDSLPAELRAADLNRDLVVDVLDVEVFELMYGLSGELSHRMRGGA